MQPTSPRPPMSNYESKRWWELDAYWTDETKPKRSWVPARVREKVDEVGDRAKAKAVEVGRKVADKAPDKVKEGGATVLDTVLEPTVRSAVALIDLAAEWVVDLNDPEKVLEFHRERGRDVETLEDLRRLDLSELDEMAKGFTTRWRAFGAAEGAALGALALVPVVGTAVSVPADALVIHLLSTGIATRAAYTYGLDAQDETLAEHLERMVRNTYAAEATEAGVDPEVVQGAVVEAEEEPETVLGHEVAKVVAVDTPVPWSEQLQDDQRVIEAIERLMKAASGSDKPKVPIGKIAKKLPIVGIVTSAGSNGRTLAAVATNAQAYAQTLYLADKHGRELPAALRKLDED